MRNETRLFRLVAVGLVAFAASVLGYMVWVVVSPIDLPFQRVDRSMQLAARVDGQTLSVTGTTDLPDGAVIDWDLWREPVDDIEWPSGEAVVRSGAFSFNADLAGWRSGNAVVEASFSCDWGATAQPKQVTELVGEHCEHLGGEQVYVDSPGDPKQLFVSTGFFVTQP